MPTKTFLSYVNDVIVDINEVELTSGDFLTATGIPKTVKNGVNRAIKDIIGKELEWPFNSATYTQALTAGTGQIALPAYRSVDWNSFYIQTTNLVTNSEFTTAITSWTDLSGAGSTAAYTSTGNGRARLTGNGVTSGAIEQALATVNGRTYKILVGILGNDVAVRVGTSSGGTELLSETITLDDDGGEQIFDLSFTATGTTSYIGFYNTSTTAADIDFVRVRENIAGKALRHISFDQWRARYKEQDSALSASNFNLPQMVYHTKDDKFGVTPVPNQENYEVTFDYWTIPDEMSVYSDTCTIPDRYAFVVIAGASVYAYSTLSDVVFRDRARKDFEDGVKTMRRELINKVDEAYV